MSILFCQWDGGSLFLLSPLTGSHVHRTCHYFPAHGLGFIRHEPRAMCRAVLSAVVYPVTGPH